MDKKAQSKEFERSAVEMVAIRQQTRSSVAKRPGVNSCTLREWLESVSPAASEAVSARDLPVEQHLRELEKDNARLDMVRSIPRTATSHCAREHL